MRILKGLILCLSLVTPLIATEASFAQNAQGSRHPVLQIEAEQLLALANEARAAAGAGPLRWDAGLATAARQHCLRMAAEGPISHQYGGEPDLAARAGQAGAHFSLIEENVAIGPTPPAIHDAWMHSPGHRTNLLNPDVDRAGIAVVASRGVLYAVADYARVVQPLMRAQIEAQVAELIRVRGVAIASDPAQARAACATDRGLPGSSAAMQPRFVMRWQDSDLTHLPQALADRLGTGKYRQAAVGNCPAQDLQGSFTAYRVAVLLY
ncbi:MAG: CAP domain-containing protein [Terracidiphilus sp.]|jgi:hypothetical protein